MNDCRAAGKKTLNALKNSIFVLLGIILLTGLVLAATPKGFFVSFSTGNPLIDPLVGAAFGSVATGNPITSYVIGGELLKEGVSFFAVTAFILAWVTVGVIQLPAESLMLGKRFALARNAVSFVLAIVVAVLTVITLGAFA